MLLAVPLAAAWDEPPWSCEVEQATIVHQPWSRRWMMRAVELSTVLEADASRAWDAVTSPALLCHVAAPVLRFPGLAGRTQPWREGEQVTTWLLLFGVLPVSFHHLQMRLIDAEQMRIVAHEWGGVVRRWNHSIWIEPLGVGWCRYTDRIEIDAGRLTVIVAGFAALFYRHRQRRWRRLARRHLATPGRGAVAAPR